MGAANAEGNLHLRVKYASILLHDTHSFIEGLNGVESTLAVRDDGCKTELHVLWVELGGETIAKRLLLARGNLNVIASSRQIAYNYTSLADILGPQAAANEGDGDWCWLIVRDGKQCLGWVSVDELDPEDL